MRLSKLAFAAMILTGISGGSAVAADPKPHADMTAGGEIIEFGSFECVASPSSGKPALWECPAQKYDSKFRDSPIVFFSVAGLANVAPADGSLSIAMSTKGEITEQGFQPVLDGKLGTAATSEKSSVSVNWIAVGPGEKKQRAKRERKRDQ